LFPDSIIHTGGVRPGPGHQEEILRGKEIIFEFTLKGDKFIKEMF